jgi:hypothetical protein
LDAKKPAGASFVISIAIHSANHVRAALERDKITLLLEK